MKSPREEERAIESPKERPKRRIGKGPTPCWVCGHDDHKYGDCPRRKKNAVCGVCGSQAHRPIMCSQRFYPEYFRKPGEGFASQKANAGSTRSERPPVASSGELAIIRSESTGLTGRAAAPPQGTPIDEAHAWGMQVLSNPAPLRLSKIIPAGTPSVLLVRSIWKDAALSC